MVSFIKLNWCLLVCTCELLLFCTKSQLSRSQSISHQVYGKKNSFFFHNNRFCFNRRIPWRQKQHCSWHWKNENYEEFFAEKSLHFLLSDSPDQWIENISFGGSNVFELSKECNQNWNLPRKSCDCDQWISSSFYGIDLWEVDQKKKEKKNQTDTRTGNTYGAIITREKKK